MIPVIEVGREWVQSFGHLDPSKRFSPPPPVNQNICKHGRDISVVGIERKRSIEVHLGPVVLPSKKEDLCKDAMRPSVAFIDVERRLDLSKPYRRSGVGLAVRPDRLDVQRFEDLIGRRVAVQSRSLAAMLLAQRGVRLASFGFEEEMVEAVAREEVDAAAVSPATVGYYNLRHPDAPVRFVHAYESEPELRWDLAVGLRRADPPLREAIDGALDRLATAGTIEKIYARYGIEYRPALTR